MNELLQHTDGLPEVSLAPGEAVVREGEFGQGLWILVSGSLQVSKGGTLVNSISTPGAVIGEISLLLDAPFSATVVARVPSVLRYAADGRGFLMSTPAITRSIATDLAARLDYVTTYLADLKIQHGDAPGLARVSDVLHELSNRQRPSREPNPGD